MVGRLPKPNSGCKVKPLRRHPSARKAAGYYVLPRFRVVLLLVVLFIIYIPTLPVLLMLLGLPLLLLPPLLLLLEIFIRCPVDTHEQMVLRGDSRVF